MTMRFRVLGAVEAYREDQRLDLGHARQRCVLAALLVEANATLLAEQLIERVWGDSPPRQARNALHTYLVRLRKALAVAPEVAIVQRSGSYQLTTDRQAVDMHQFRHLITLARSADADQEALSLFEQALSLWQGEPFADLDTAWLSTIRATLDRERTAAELDYTDTALRCGLHAAILPILTTRVRERPLDERLTGQLMVALYRAGRQADALRAFQETRRNLADDLGIDPSPTLRRLEKQILNGDPSLAAPSGQAQHAPAPVPHQLPTAPRLFTGRREELDLLSTAVDDTTESDATTAICAITGAGGVGKTWLALHWAHSNIDRFPDGQLHINLRGFDPSREPTDPATAIRCFLDALAVPPTAIPTDLDTQVGLYRSLVAAKRILIILDNARDTNQITPLLPGSPTATVLITSRHRLAGLATAHGARLLPLDLLVKAEALELLNQQLGRVRVAAEPAPVDELLRLCAGLPLALGLAAGRTAAQPDLPLTVLAEELRDSRGRLDALDAGEANLNMRSVLSCSYLALTPAAATVFALLGLPAGPDLTVPAIASLADRSPPEVKVSLREIETIHLIQQHVAGRYRMHDLVRLYASERAAIDVPAADREAALLRLYDHYLHTAFTGDRLLDPHRAPIDAGEPTPGCHVQPLTDETAAWRWFEAEHANLCAIHQLAAESGWHVKIWQLAWTLDTFHHRRGRQLDWLVMWRVGLRAAEQLGDRTVQAMAHRRLGHAATRLARHEDAVGHLQRALDLAEQTGDRVAQGLAHHALALAWEEQGDDQRALEHASSGLALQRSVGTPPSESLELNQISRSEAKLGRYQQARVHCEAALALARRHGFHTGAAAAIENLGHIAHRTGQHTQALAHFQEAIALYHHVGNAYEIANTLSHLGDIYLALGQQEQARDVWQQAVDLCRAQHRLAEVERVQRRLAVTFEQPPSTRRNGRAG